MTTKTCRDCNTTKPTSDFYKASGSDRPRSYCKPCATKRTTEDAKKRKAKSKLKVCVDCNKEQPLDNFSFNKRGKPISYCKPCNSSRSIKRYHGAKNTIMFFMSNQWNITV